MFSNPDFHADYYRMTGGGFRLSPKFFIDFMFRHNLRFMYWFRRRQKTNGLLAKIQLYRYSRKFGLEVSPTAAFGPGIMLGHAYNITIGDGVELGSNVNIHKGATIGVENRGRRMGAPKIGSNVYIGINAVVVGNIRIGDDVMIAPGSFVNFDVPDHSIVLGNPAKICHRENATEGYVRFRI